MILEYLLSFSLAKLFTFISLLCGVGFILARRFDGVKAPLIGRGLETITSLATLSRARKLMHEGYLQYPDSLFKMRMFPCGMLTIVTDPKLIDELRNASDEYLSFHGLFEKMIQPAYTMHPLFVPNRHHVSVVRSTLTRNIASLFPEVVEEMQIAFEDNIRITSGKGWISVPAYDTMLSIICRTTHRIIVGAPLCRDAEYQRINRQFTVDAAKTAHVINLFPTFMQPLIGCLVSKRHEYQLKILRMLDPVISERRTTSSVDKPKDYLTWMMEVAPPGYESTNAGIAMRMLHINFASVHTSTSTLTHALYYLAVFPGYAGVLREEVENILERDGWTKEATQKMLKLDSFLRESARLNPITLTSLTRKVVKNFTLSNGTCLPKGTFVTASMYPIHLDETNYPDALKFSPWRFSNMRSTDEEGVKHQYVHTSDEFLSFGFGKHACPGRFFAVTELKAMMSYILIHYDIKMADGLMGKKPHNEYAGMNVLPNTKAHLFFRKRGNPESKGFL